MSIAANPALSEAVPRTVLLVEDEAAIAIPLCDDLADHGFHVTHAADGLAALDLLGRRSFEAVITDLRLPGADGTRVAAVARGRQPRTRVLVITALVPPHMQAAVAAIGPVLRKPFPNLCVLAWLREGRWPEAPCHGQ